MALERLTRLARDVEANWCAAWASLGNLHVPHPTFVDDVADYVRVVTPGMPEMLLNIVLRYAGPAPVSREAIERVIAPYRQHRLPFQWWLTAGTQPEGLREQLRGLGMQTWGGATSMALDVEGWAPQYPSPARPQVTFGRIGSEREAKDALRVICEVFFVPPLPMARWTTENPAFQVYAARQGEQTVCALATLHRGTVCGVYHVATLPSARRQGIAGNLLLLALRDAQAAGCTQATLTATSEARALYERLGFRACGTIEQWVPGPHLTMALAQGLRPSAGNAP